MSLDGYIAGPNGEYDWIISDPAIDFKAIWAQFDLLLMGRRTFELTVGQSKGKRGFDKKVAVVSTTLKAADHPGIEIIDRDVAVRVAALKQQPGKDIWLFGGGILFSSLLASGLVDRVELAVIPVLLGAGIPMLRPPCPSAKLKLVENRALASGIVQLTYEPTG
jgi:dihydrofolate reductase